MLPTKNILVALELGGFLISFLLRNLPASLCTQTYEFGGQIGCFDKFPIALSNLLFVFTPVLLIFSLITYFLPEKVFRTWLRFTYVWVPLSFVIVLFSSDYRPPTLVGASDQAVFGILTWGLYVLISLGIMVWKYVTIHRT